MYLRDAERGARDIFLFLSAGTWKCIGGWLAFRKGGMD